MKKLLFTLTLAVMAGPVLAQSSAAYTQDEHTFNAGGGTASSASFSISMGSIGEGVIGTALGSASYNMDGGFLSAYPPPKEIAGLQFLDHDTLEWDADSSAGSYNLYRDLVSNLSGLGYGNCSQQNLSSPSATDADAAPSGDGYFYLATAVNRLVEEGSKGADSSDTTRAGTACP